MLQLNFIYVVSISDTLIYQILESNSNNIVFPSTYVIILTLLDITHLDFLIQVDSVT